jgi:hypothetical protein
MKRVGLWAIGIGVLASMAGLAVPPGYVGEHEGKCTMATLNGQYLFSTSGLLFPPACGVKSVSTGAAAGAHVFNGDGTGTDFLTFTVNGVVAVPSSSVATTYTLGPDCTGTYQVPSVGLKFDIFVAVDGSWLSLIETDNTGVVSAQGPLPRVRLDR